MRKLFAFAGVSTLLVAWFGPLAQLAHEAFFGHMIMHMLNVAIAAPLISFAIAGSPFDPARKHPLIFAAIPASVVELIVVWTWHAPVPHHIARHSVGGLIAEQSMFLLAGIWVWLSAFGGKGHVPVRKTHNSHHDGSKLIDPSEQRGSRNGAGVIGLLLTSMHMTLLGALLALAPRPLYGHHDGFAGMSPLQDQQLGGAVMLLVGGIVYLSGGLWLSFELIRKNRT
jgi:putative membrane protein